MTDQQFQKLIDILGSIGTQAYQSAYQEAIINGHIALAISFGGAVLFLTSVIVLIASCRVYAANLENRVSDDLPPATIIVSFFVGAGTFVIAIMQGITAYQNLTNPSWRAIEYLAQIVTGR